jgi:hypothetical protein
VNANLYLDRMDLARYCGGETCELCRVDSFPELLERLRSGGMATGACPHWPAWRREAFALAMNAGEFLPPVPSLPLPRPAPAGLIALNAAEAAAPVLVSGNSEFTQAVLLAVLSRTRAPLKLLSVDTRGNTVDMALVYGELTVAKIATSLRQDSGPPWPRLILPGLAEGLAPELERELGTKVEVGPVCAAELPLYLGEAWIPA